MFNDHPWSDEEARPEFPGTDPDDKPPKRPELPKSTPIPVTWPLFWRFAKWRGGVPLGIVLFAIGASNPHYIGVAVWGGIVLLFALARRIVKGWKRDIDQWNEYRNPKSRTWREYTHRLEEWSKRNPRGTPLRSLSVRLSDFKGGAHDDGMGAALDAEANPQPDAESDGDSAAL